MHVQSCPLKFAGGLLCKFIMINFFLQQGWFEKETILAPSDVMHRASKLCALSVPMQILMLPKMYIYKSNIYPCNYSKFVQKVNANLRWKKGSWIRVPNFQNVFSQGSRNACFYTGGNLDFKIKIISQKLRKIIDFQRSQMKTEPKTSK